MMGEHCIRTARAVSVGCLMAFCGLMACTGQPEPTSAREVPTESRFAPVSSFNSGDGHGSTRQERVSGADSDSMCTGREQQLIGQDAAAGRLPDALIRDVVLAHGGPLGACYSEQRKADPEWEARVSLRFTVEPDGSVATASATVQPPSRDFARCIVHVVEGMPFPQSKCGAADVLYPLAVAPHAPDAER